MMYILSRKFLHILTSEIQNVSSGNLICNMEIEMTLARPTRVQVDRKNDSNLAHAQRSLACACMYSEYATATHAGHRSAKPQPDITQHR